MRLVLLVLLATGLALGFVMVAPEASAFDCLPVVGCHPHVPSVCVPGRYCCSADPCPPPPE